MTLRELNRRLGSRSELGHDVVNEHKEADEAEQLNQWAAQAAEDDNG